MLNDDRAQILAAVDLVELIGQTVALKRRGRSYLGLCPFHQEKTPSFHVHPDKQFFHCFGCKASGTAFDFVMKRDRVEFKDALAILARHAGIELKSRSGDSKPGERQALLDAHSAACQFFEHQLYTPLGEPARQYLAQRGFTEASLKQFKVGLAPDGWDNLLKGPVGRKFGPQVLLTAGLVKARGERGDGHYDTFRNRILFPIRGENGQTIAFGGRVMPGSSDPAKYLNSPETPLFSKSRAVFGLDLARQRVVETRIVAVCEGYTDVMMAHQYGAGNVVSVLGTAMTESHVQILRRFADRIVLVFDADEAGGTAVDRVVQLFLTQPVEIAVASIPEGLDPDEFVVKNGAAEWERLITSATDALEYAWRQTWKRYVSNEGDLTGQQKATEQYIDLLASIGSSSSIEPVRWGSVLRLVSRKTEIPLEELHRRMKRTRQSAARSAVGAHVSTTSTPAAVARKTAAGVPDARERAERQIIGVLLAEPKRWLAVQLSLGPEDFAHEGVRPLAEKYWSHQRDEGEVVFREFLDTLSDASLKELAVELLELGESLADETTTLDATLDGAISYLAEQRERRRQEKALAAVKAQGNASPEAEIELVQKLLEGRKPDLRRVSF